MFRFRFRLVLIQGLVLYFDGPFNGIVQQAGIQKPHCEWPCVGGGWQKDEQAFEELSRPSISCKDTRR
jgi:hypothetical protein